MLISLCGNELGNSEITKNRDSSRVIDSSNAVTSA